MKHVLPYLADTQQIGETFPHFPHAQFHRLTAQNIFNQPLDTSRNVFSCSLLLPADGSSLHENCRHLSIIGTQVFSQHNRG